MTSSPTSPTWYDLLDVDPSATTDEIRAAWKAAVADLDPTDRRFQRLSEAAAVLLDADRRAAYDASLAAAADERAAELPEGLAAGAAVGVAVGVEAPGRRLRWARSARRVLSGPGPVAAGVEPAAERVRTEAAPEEAAGPRRQVPLWLLAAAAVLALVLVPAAAYSWTRPDPTAIEQGAEEARAAAERAVVPVLSYDYRTLDAGQKEAEKYLTTRYRDKDYRPLFETIKQNAPGTQTVVTTSVVESAIVRAGEDRVQVLLLVDRPTTNKKQTTPITYEDHVTVTMEHTADGWLIDDMET